MTNWARVYMYLFVPGFLGMMWVANAQAVNSGCAELADPREGGLPTPPAGVPQVVCAGFFPSVLSLDGSESTRLEVGLAGNDITAAGLGNQFPVVGVAIDGEALPQTGGFIELFDDGTHGDRVAGDGIWSRGGITISNTPLPPIYSVEFGTLRYTDNTGTHEINVSATSAPGQYGPARLGALDPALKHPIVNQGNGFYQTPNVIFMIDSAAQAELRWLLRGHPPTADIWSVMQHFYDVYPDVFDFAVLTPGSHVPGGFAGLHQAVSNQIQGIGRPIHDDTALWGSAGQLQSAMAINWSDGGPVLHEIIHRWGAYLNNSLGLQQCTPGHWGVAGIGVSPLGGFNPGGMVNNGNGTWSVPSIDFGVGGASFDIRAMTPLDLYLAGFIEAAAVPPFPVPVNVDCFSISYDGSTGMTTFAADGMVTRSIADVINQQGARIPSASDAQRHFDLAWIVVMNRPPTPSEAGWHQHRSEYLGRPEPGNQAFRLTFHDAVHGLARLNTRIDRAGQIFSDRFQ